MILILGGSGQLGNSLIHCLDGEISAPCHKELDITNEKKIAEYIEKLKPEIIINCAAYNKVDLAEKETEECMAVNAYAPENIANVCAKKSIYLIHISTDFVFDGMKKTEYDTNDLPNPISVYGKSKFLGERAVLSHNNGLVIRTAWLYSENDNNFVGAIINKAKRESEISVVGDQIGSPTYAHDLANAIKEIMEKRTTGILHATNEGKCSRVDFARAILSGIGSKTKVLEISSNVFGSAAKRPEYSVLSKQCLDRISVSRLPEWNDALIRCIEKKKEQMG